jgi:hypothetical protein
VSTLITFILTLKSRQPEAEAIHALRRLLKFALRQCGFRCVSAEQQQEELRDGRE